MKKIINIPDYIIQQIERLKIPSNTFTGKILILLEHGISYEVKKMLNDQKRKEKIKAVPAEKYPEVTADQENNTLTERQKQMIEIAKVNCYEE